MEIIKLSGGVEREPLPCPVIALEAPSNAGKTTQLHILNRELGYPVIGEYFQYMRMFPPMKSDTLPEAIDNLNSFVDSSKQISEDIRKIAAEQSTKGCVITDRSLWTLLATRYALIEIEEQPKEIVKYFRDFLDKVGTVAVLPTEIIYLDVPTEITNARWKTSRRTNKIPELYNPNFNMIYRQFFINLQMVKGYNVKFINGTAPIQNVTQEIVNCIDQTIQRTQSNCENS